jgi:RNA polymerase sigma-70 factor (sigma-E family)
VTEKISFDEFVTVRSPRLLRLAYLLTQDHALAEDVLQTALARSWSAWPRIDGDPEPYVRRVLVNTHNSWWRRRSSTERPVDELPVLAMTAPQNDVDNRDQVWRALSRLPKQQRAVLVLRYFEDLTEEQIAATLGLAPGTVKSYAAKGLAKLRVDPTLSTLPLPEPVDTPAGTERLVAVRERIRRRRRNKIITAATAVGVIVAIIIGYALAPHLRDRALPPPTHEGFSEYISGYHVVAAKEATFADATDVTVEWTPTTLDIELLLKCTHDAPGASVWAQLRINGTPLGEGTCDGAANFPEPGYTDTPSYEELVGAGVAVGRPASVSVTVHSTVPGDVAGAADAPIPGHGWVAVAIGEKVPFDQYPLPTRPATLAPLARDFNGPSQDVTIIEAGGRHQAGLRWDHDLEFSARAQTPGALIVKVNGTTLQTMTWWDYGQGGWATSLTRESSEFAQWYGETIVITIEPEHMTGDWYVAISPS